VQGSRRHTVFSPWHLLAAALAGLFAIELFFDLQPFNYGQQPPAGAARDNLLQVGDIAERPQSAVTAWSAVLLDRPLFNSSRRPLALSIVRAPPPAIPRLSGIMVTPTEKVAVFSPAKGDPIIAAEHSRLGPFTVLAITQDSVTVKGPAGVLVLHTDVDPLARFIKITPGDHILPGGIDLDQIYVALPSAATWVGPPTAY
jgi:hypothetical protein